MSVPQIFGFTLKGALQLAGETLVCLSPGRSLEALRGKSTLSGFRAETDLIRLDLLAWLGVKFLEMTCPYQKG